MLDNKCREPQRLGWNAEPCGVSIPACTNARRRLGESRPRPMEEIANIGLLVVGFGLGQGAIFIVQTVLVAAGEYELLAAFGTHYSFAILGIVLVDAGASTTLARAVARLPSGREARGEVWRTFCETSAIRITVALIVGAAAALYVW